MKKIVSLLIMLTFIIFMSGCNYSIDKIETTMVYIQIGDECFVTYEYVNSYHGFSGIANIKCENVGKDIILLNEEEK